MNKFAERLRDERIVANMTTSQLAEKLNVAVRTVQRWEHNDRQPDFDMLILISNVLNISIDYLLGKID